MKNKGTSYLKAIQWFWYHQEKNATQKKKILHSGFSYVKNNRTLTFAVGVLNCTLSNLNVTCKPCIESTRETQWNNPKKAVKQKYLQEHMSYMSMSIFCSHVQCRAPCHILWNKKHNSFETTNGPNVQKQSSMVFFLKDVLKICSKFTREHSCQSDRRNQNPIKYLGYFSKYS